MVVGVPGFEPGTSRLSAERSNQLSYTPEAGEIQELPTQIHTYSFKAEQSVPNGSFETSDDGL